MLTTHTNGARARVGLQGHLWVPKRSQMIFSKTVPRPLGVLKQTVYGYFEPYVTHASPSKFPKPLEMGNLRTDSAYRE